MKLVIMTQPTFFVEEDKILTTLFDEGMDNLHLCKPGASPIYSERLLSLLPDTAYNKITVHDHFYLKAEYRLAGIHLDNPDAEVPKDYKGKFSRTCTDLSALGVMKKKAEYVFLKSAFGKNEKTGEEFFTMTELEKAAAQGLIDRHVYAMGGMNAESIKAAKDMGFGGVVICGDLWNKFNIHSELDYKELISHFEKLRKAVS